MMNLGGGCWWTAIFSSWVLGLPSLLRWKSLSAWATERWTCFSLRIARDLFFFHLMSQKTSKRSTMPLSLDLAEDDRSRSFHAHLRSEKMHSEVFRPGYLRIFLFIIWVVWVLTSTLWTVSYLFSQEWLPLPSDWWVLHHYFFLWGPPSTKEL